MGQPAEKIVHRATYTDLEAVPETMVAEIINGMLHTLPRPAPRHAWASSTLGVKLGGPFGMGEGGPGGWRILDEPELHFQDPFSPGEVDVLVPDLAGWRIERMPKLPKTSYFTLAPDWVCEVLSASTASFDRAEKMPIYARQGVKYIWLIDPIARGLEVFVLSPERKWILDGAYHATQRVRAVPFDAIEIDCSILWAEIEE